MGETYEDFDFDAAKNSLPDRASSPLTALETSTVTVIKCQCGHAFCNRYGLSDGDFPQGTGWPKYRAEQYAQAINRDAAFEALVAALTTIADQADRASLVQDRSVRIIKQACAIMASEAREALALAQPDTAERKQHEEKG